MRSLNSSQVRPYRKPHPTFGWGDDSGGYYEIENMRIIASNGGDWDHVSVSLLHRTPTWEEMCRIKSLFFDDEECVLQYHPPESEYVNNHEFVLHLWRPQTDKIPTPPIWMV